MGFDKVISFYNEKQGTGKTTLAYNLSRQLGIPFIEARLTDWFNEVNNPNVNFGYPILDLFHWEVSTGSWQTQNQLEWDIVHETFTPFNNRELLDTLKPRWWFSAHLHVKFHAQVNHARPSDTVAGDSNLTTG